MRRIAAILFTHAAFLFLSVDVALACQCARFTPDDAFQRTDAVFVGRVIEKGWFSPYVEFQVEKAWKSVDSDEVTVYVQERHCAGPLKFTSGERYVVYANRKGGEYLYTNICSTTKHFADAQEQLIYLESKSTISVSKKFWNRNMRIGLITGAFILGFLGIGYMAMRIKRRAA